MFCCQVIVNGKIFRAYFIDKDLQRSYVICASHQFRNNKKKQLGNRKFNTYIQSIPIKFGINTGYFENI